MKKFYMCLLVLIILSVSCAVKATSKSELLAAVNSGNTTKAFAIINNKPSLVNARLNEDEDTPLIIAAEKGHVELVEKLISRHAKLEFKDSRESTALHSAVDAEEVECVRILIKHKANVNTKDYNLHTPLLDTDNLQIARMLVIAGADVNAKDNCKMTPLHWAACLNHVEIAELLVKHGAKVNAREDDGLPPIYFASHSCKLTKFLIAHGANPKEKFESGWTLLHQAAAGPLDPPPPFPGLGTSKRRHNIDATAQAESNKVVKIFIDNGVDVNAIAKNWGTPLHVAAFHGCTEIARQLIACGANASMKDKDGKTPLQVALENEHANTAELLRGLNVQ